jgi:hypothetical protein
MHAGVVLPSIDTQASARASARMLLIVELETELLGIELGSGGHSPSCALSPTRGILSIWHRRTIGTVATAVLS